MQDIATDVILPGGEVVDGSDADALISEYERASTRAQLYLDAKRTLALAIARLTHDDERKTRRVEGKTRRAKVTMPDDAYEQSILREAYNAYPQHRDRALRIASLAVRKRELDKLQGTAGPKDLEAFVAMIDRANRGPSGTPRVTIEK